MDVSELNSILNSDFQLWEKAQYAETARGFSKTLDLPHGIGSYTVNFEGEHNAEARRNAVSAFGQCIRDAIDNVISEESVTARAAQRAAKVRPSTSGDDDGSSAIYTGDGDQVPEEETVPASSEAAPFSADPSSRLLALRSRAEQYERRARELRLESKALEAYIEVLRDAHDNEEKAQREVVEDVKTSSSDAKA